MDTLTVAMATESDATTLTIASAPVWYLTIGDQTYGPIEGKLELHKDQYRPWTQADANALTRGLRQVRPSRGARRHLRRVKAGLA